MARHYDSAVKEGVIALIRNANMRVSDAGAQYGVNRATAYRWWKRYQERGNVARKNGSGRPRASSAVQDRSLIEECRRHPFMSARQLKQASGFPGDVNTVRRRLRNANLRSFRAARKEKLSESHMVDRLAFAEENIGRVWDGVAFTDEKVFSTANDGPRRVYRPPGTRYEPRYMARSSRMGHVTIHCWGWICKDAGGGGIHRINGRLNGQKYLELLQDALPEIRARLGDGIVQLQQDHSSVHDCNQVQAWLQQEPHVELVDWVPRAADLNPIENVWSAVVRELQENWPQNPPRTRDELWELVQHAWTECVRRRYIARLIDSIPNRLQAVIQVNGDYTRY